MPERLAFRFASVSLVACWCVLPATAAELAIRDVGVEFLTLPSDFDYEITSSTRSVSGSDGFDSAYGLRLGGAYSFTGPGDRSGLLVGAGALISRAIVASDGELFSYGLDGGVGYAFAVSDSIVLQALGRAGVGVSDLSLPNNTTFSGYDGTGAYLTYGVEAGASWAVKERLVLSATVGYQFGTHQLSGDGADITLDTAGITMGLGLAWRLVVNPWRLE